MYDFKSADFTVCVNLSLSFQYYLNFKLKILANQEPGLKILGILHVNFLLATDLERLCGIIGDH